MKKLIFQYYISKDPLPDWALESIKRFKRYAELVEADYIFENKSFYSPECTYFEHLRLIYEDKFSEYDMILYADVDVIVENFDENIFDMQIEDIGMVPEYKAEGMNATPLFVTTEYRDHYKSLSNRFNIPVVKPASVKADYLMFNSGVILWTRAGLQKAKKTFLDWTHWNKSTQGHYSLDQPYMNGQVIKNLKYTELPLKWNCFPKFRFHPGKEPINPSFVHYTGGKKKFIKEIYGRFEYEN